jgi:hypothetical protein
MVSNRLSNATFNVLSLANWVSRSSFASAILVSRLSASLRDFDSSAVSTMACSAEIMRSRIDLICTFNACKLSGETKGVEAEKSDALISACSNFTCNSATRFSNQTVAFDAASIFKLT